MTALLEINLLVECSGTYERAEGSHRARINDFIVFLRKQNGVARVEITDFLSDCEHQDLYVQFLNELEGIYGTPRKS